MWNIYIQQAILSIHYYQNKNTVGILAIPSKKVSSACHHHPFTYYYTSEKASWYPKPEHGIHSSAIPLVFPLPQMNMDEKSVVEMQNYACTYGAAVRQRITRQETTMAKHGTMPEMIYQRKLVITEKINFASHKDSVVDEEQTDSTRNEVEETELE